QVHRGECLEPDLWCPFQPCPFWAEDEVGETGTPKSTQENSVAQATAATKKFEGRVNDALIAAATPAEQRRATAKGRTSTKKPNGKVIKFPRTSKEDLLKGADFLDDEL